MNKALRKTPRNLFSVPHVPRSPNHVIHGSRRLSNRVFQASDAYVAINSSAPETVHRAAFLRLIRVAEKWARFVVGTPPSETMNAKELNQFLNMVQRRVLIGLEATPFYEVFDENVSAGRAGLHYRRSSADRWEYHHGPQSVMTAAYAPYLKGNLFLEFVRAHEWVHVADFTERGLHTYEAQTQEEEIFGDEGAGRFFLATEAKAWALQSRLLTVSEHLYPERFAKEHRQMQQASLNNSLGTDLMRLKEPPFSEAFHEIIGNYPEAYWWGARFRSGSYKLSLAYASDTEAPDQSSVGNQAAPIEYIRRVYASPRTL